MGYGYGYGGGASGGGSLKNMPAELAPKPWTLDYTPNLNGVPDLPQGQLPGVVPRYPDKLWDPALVAGLAATEFAGKIADWGPSDAVLGVTELDWQTTQSFITQELNYLLALMADDRDRYMPEILAQAENAPVYWMQLLNLGGSEKPATNALINFATRAGEIVALHFKLKYKRVRPSTLCPGLLLPFGPPRHPAFPSGHSLTAHLTTYILNEIPSVNATVGPELTWLADRVAKNRERAGLHYPSDSVAGRLLAQAIRTRLMTKSIPPAYDYRAFGVILEAAKLEWT